MGNLTDPDWSQLPTPSDDGAAAHLVGRELPFVSLTATDGGLIDLSSLDGRSVVYSYPLTARPGTPLPDDWDMIPGARGCTPQSCAFRDHYGELTSMGVAHVFGLSTQDTAYQREAAERLHLPFPLLSDADLRLANALKMPTFVAAGVRLLRRMTMIIDDGRITHVFYPVFPPDRNARDVIDWLAPQRRDG